MNTIFWDWNGTLMDDMALVYAAACHIFSEHGKQPPTMEEYFHEFKGDYIHLYRDRGIDTDRDGLNEIFASYYLSNIDKAILVDKAMYVLKTLHEAGVRMYLLTGQLEHLVNPFWDKFKIREYFNAGTYYHVLDKAAALREIMEYHNLNPRECCLVGDTPADMMHAENAGVIQVAFLGEDTSTDVFGALSPDYFISHLSELLTILGSKVK